MTFFSSSFLSNMSKTQGRFTSQIEAKEKGAAPPPSATKLKQMFVIGSQREKNAVL